jgi:hypothetical protein
LNRHSADKWADRAGSALPFFRRRLVFLFSFTPHPQPPCGGKVGAASRRALPFQTHRPGSAPLCDLRGKPLLTRIDAHRAPRQRFSCRRSEVGGLKSPRLLFHSKSKIQNPKSKIQNSSSPRPLAAFA